MTNGQWFSDGNPRFARDDNHALEKRGPAAGVMPGVRIPTAGSPIGMTITQGAFMLVTLVRPEI
jgi:hypothetical protein